MDRLISKEERELAIEYLEGMKEKYIEGYGYERHPLPEYYAIETAIKALAIPSADMFSDLKAEISMYKNSEQSIDEMIQGIKSIISIYKR